MEVVYSSSDSYSMCTGISMYSLFLNNKNISELNIHILSTDICAENRKKLENIANVFGRKINIIDAKDVFVNESKRLGLRLFRGAYNTYSRLMLNQWFSDIDKILVVDSDTLVVGDISDIWSVNMDNYLIAAVPELGAYTKYSHLEDQNIILSVPMYYNMGICLINLKKWREDNIDNLIAEKITDKNCNWKIADQSIINKYLNDYIYRLDLRYNFYSSTHNVKYSTITEVFSRKRIFSKNEFLEAQKNPAIIHYFGHSFERPWFKHSVALEKKKYNKIKESTDWRDVKPEKWRYKRNTFYELYDFFCYLLLKLNMFDFCLNFRYNGGQFLKGFIK